MFDRSFADAQDDSQGSGYIIDNNRITYEKICAYDYGGFDHAAAGCFSPEEH